MLESADFLHQDLLLAWLSAEGDRERERVLASHADRLTTDAAAALLQLARGGPGYGADRRAEAAMQVALLELAIAAADRAGAPAIAAPARRLLAATLVDDPAAEAALLERAAEDAGEADAPREQALALVSLARLQAESGRARLAMASYDRAVTALKGVPDAVEEAEQVLAEATHMSEGAGESGLALATLHRWHEHCRERGDRLALGQAGYALGGHLVALGEYEEARAPLREALALLSEMGDDGRLIRTHLRLLVAHYALGEPEAAAQHLAEAMRLRSRLDDPAVLAEIEREFGQLM